MKIKDLKNKMLESTKDLSIEELTEVLDKTKTELEKVKNERDYLRRVLQKINTECSKSVDIMGKTNKFLKFIK